MPRFTDEQIEVLYALPLYRQQALPLIGPDPYNGPLHTYLLAGAFWIFGPEPQTPRLLSVLVGVATIVATYCLGRRLGGRLAGCVAAGLLATSATHVLVNSHVAWSNATTPLFTTLAFLALLPAIDRGSGPHLALGGLAFALALQTHPSVATFLPGVGLALLLKQGSLLRSRWLLLAGLLFLLGYGNVLVYNLQPAGQDPYRLAAASLLPGWFTADGDTASRLGQQLRTYAGGQGGPTFYLANLGSLAHNLPRLAASLVEPRPAWTGYLAQPAFWLYGALIPVGLLWPTRRGNPLPLLSGLSFLLLMPLFTGKYEPIFNGRYLMPLLPLAFAGLGTLAADLWHRLAHPPARLALAALLAGLILYPLVSLVRYEQRALADGQINLDLIQTAAAIQTERGPDEPVLLDEALGRRSLPADGDLLQSLQLLLELRGVPYRVGSASLGKIAAELDPVNTALLVVAQPHDRGLERPYRLIALSEKTGGRYALYRLLRRG